MEFVYDSLPTLLGAASAAVPMLQSQHLHQREMERSLELHRQAIQQAADFHEADKAMAYALHKDALQKALNQHIEDIQLTIEAARRENLRDVWAQKSRRAETLLIMSSLMIAGFFTLVVEGLPPSIAPPVLVGFYAACTALGFCALFNSVFVTMKYQSRMADFNIYNVKQVYTCGRQHEAFESYYECHCGKAAKAATLLFYAGTLFLLCAATLLQFTRWSNGYDNVTAGAVYVAISGCGMLSFVAVNLFTPTKTRALNTMSDAEAAEQDARQMDRGQMGDSLPIKRVLSTGVLASGLGRKSFITSLRRRKKPTRVASEASAERAAFNDYLDKRTAMRAQSSEAGMERSDSGPPDNDSRTNSDVLPTPNSSFPNIRMSRDPGNLGSTLSPTTRRRLFESQRSQQILSSAQEEGERKKSRLRREQVEIDMDLFSDDKKGKEEADSNGV